MTIPIYPQIALKRAKVSFKSRQCFTLWIKPPSPRGYRRAFRRWSAKSVCRHYLWRKSLWNALSRHLRSLLHHGGGLLLASLFVDNDLAKSNGGHILPLLHRWKTVPLSLNYGGQRTPTSQWTATASGSLVVAPRTSPYIRGCTIGKIVDLGVSDANNMGAAMAPAAFSTISTFFTDTGMTLRLRLYRHRWPWQSWKPYSLWAFRAWKYKYPWQS